jgi:hypothetical protein
MLLFGCFLAFGAAFAPRLVLILAWIFGRRWDLVWQGNVIVPLLGIIFLPYTTIMYLLVWSPAGLSGFDWIWLGLGVMLDVMKWGQLARSRSEGFPGSQPTAVSPTASGTPAQPAATAAPAQSELDRLAELRDQGVVTEEEYQAKKEQLLGQ